MNDLTDKTILVAEDDPINMMVAVKILESKKANVIKAANGVEALAKLAGKTKIDLVLLDLEMPEMDGYNTLARIRERYGPLPVLAFTAHPLDKQMENSLIEKGFTDSISKPFKPEPFYNKIFRIFREVH